MKPTDADHLIRNTEVVQQVDPLFDAETTSPLNREALLRLAAGTLGAIRVPDMLTPEGCVQLCAQLDGTEFSTYDERRIWPPIAKFGPAVYDYYLDGQLRPEYWQDARKAEEQWAKATGADDPMEALIAQIAEAWDGPVSRATVGGRSLFAGMVRELKGDPRMHFDEVVREFPGVFDHTPIAQLGFNCYISLPEDGGELNVFRRRWRPTDDEDRIGFGWSQTIVAREPHLTLTPELGEGIFFDTRNYHFITPSTKGRRLTLAFFVGVTADNRLIIWA
ncbi:2OG-Fe(II) oxygenase [Streptomyces aurantiacus]|uniref:Prolyl 4-hydroxylase alpha subunit Fe(2+) 2OG dioxygenase domain-containing protein n=2 Tax=Streptomyces aurantiacus group TaxID=2838335 RepID=A0A7G1NVS9_9ACTN|nr:MULTISPECIES: 2OG-Fe(II) oxygenase [Streptomyces aurantiacus group]MCW8097105.1 2OG-Fe(II) oxygenase [Streptomyces tauricus]MDQ0774010.1 hypothetical protein [Streptomyces aurantiacus]BCL27208.1 hypothetical protein GCM10017557_20670 [Streptomyces aurantiacus]